MHLVVQKVLVLFYQQLDVLQLPTEYLQKLCTGRSCKGSRVELLLILFDHIIAFGKNEPVALISSKDT